MIESSFENFVFQLFVAYILPEHQECVMKNMMKNFMIIDTFVNY